MLNAYMLNRFDKALCLYKAAHGNSRFHVFTEFTEGVLSSKEVETLRLTGIVLPQGPFQCVQNTQDVTPDKSNEERGMVLTRLSKYLLSNHRNSEDLGKIIHDSGARIVIASDSYNSQIEIGNGCRHSLTQIAKMLSDIHEFKDEPRFGCYSSEFYKDDPDYNTVALLRDSKNKLLLVSAGIYKTQTPPLFRITKLRFEDASSQDIETLKTIDKRDPNPKCSPLLDLFKM